MSTLEFETPAHNFVPHGYVRRFKLSADQATLVRISNALLRVMKHPNGNLFQIVRVRAERKADDWDIEFSLQPMVPSGAIKTIPVYVMGEWIPQIDLASPVV